MLVGWHSFAVVVGGAANRLLLVGHNYRWRMVAADHIVAVAVDYNVADRCMEGTFVVAVGLVGNTGRHMVVGRRSCMALTF